MGVPLEDSSGFDLGKLLGGAWGVAKDIIPFASPVLGLLGGLFGESPEEQYKKAQEENLRRIREAIRKSSMTQRDRAQRLAQTQTSLAEQQGGRESAALGYTNPNVLSAPNVGRINQNLSETMRQIGENETNAYAQAEAGQPTVPSYEFPHALDYLSSAFGLAGQYLNSQDLLALERKRMENQDKVFEALLNKG